jgi:hypothetical protein
LCYEISSVVIAQVSPSHPHYLDAMWGKVASEALIQRWEPAREDFAKLKTFIDNNVCSVFLLAFSIVLHMCILVVCVCIRIATTARMVNSLEFMDFILC